MSGADPIEQLGRIDPRIILLLVCVGVILFLFALLLAGLTAWACVGTILCLLIGLLRLVVFLWRAVDRHWADSAAGTAIPSD